MFKLFMRSSCIFCDIVEKKAESTIVHETESILIFKDISPSAQFHLLAIPKKHIDDPKCLTVEHKPLLQEMKQALTTVLVEQFNGDPDKIIIGFHWPPFNSVRHLHMHGLFGNWTSWGWMKAYMFKENSVWFRTAEWAIENLPNASASQ